jgi:putative nucleotidyltransferase with HDIG domain
MPEPTRAAAWALLCEFTKTQALRRHALSVEASMRALARRAGVADPAEVELWGVVGMLHDFDYERFPTQDDHVWRGMEILRERGWPERVVRGIGAHAPYTGIACESPLEKAIVAADELSGFVGACALVRPSKSVRDLPPESVVKKMKDKAFARAVDRDEIKRGAAEVGMPLPELVALVIEAQRPIADRLGIGGGPAPDLEDDPVPPPP